MILKNVPLYKQKTNYTCGPASLKIVFAFWGKKVSEDKLIGLVKPRPNTGSSRKQLIKTAGDFGFVVEAGNNKIVQDLMGFLKQGQPVIVNYLWHDGDGHYSVVVGMDKDRIYLNDTYTGKKDFYTYKDFEKVWKSGDRRFGDRWLMVIKPKS